MELGGTKEESEKLKAEINRLQKLVGKETELLV